MAWMAFLAVKHRQAFREHWSLTLHHSRKSQIAGLLGTITFTIITSFIPSFWLLIPFPLLVVYIFLFVNVIEKSCFYKRISPKALVEGDWLAEEVIVHHKVILSTKTLEKNDLFLLKNLEAETKITTVLIKEGIPFIPSFLLAYIAVLGSKWWVEWILRAFFA